MGIRTMASRSDPLEEWSAIRSTAQASFSEEVKAGTLARGVRTKQKIHTRTRRHQSTGV